MTPSLSETLPLSRSSLDRDHSARSRPALFDELWEEPDTRVLPLWRDRALFARPDPRDAAAEPALALLPVAEVPSALVRVYLGRTLTDRAGVPAGSAVVAEVLTDAAATELAPDASDWIGLRGSAASLGALDASVYTEALAIANWHESHVCCPRCGSPTIVEMGGWVRRCVQDGSEHFPRTDPAVIVGVLDGEDRILLGSNAMWERGRFSVLAGFVEPGESFESAVQREILEESGARVVELEYLGSQPWPFPRSVMIGFLARLDPDQDPASILADGEEILELRWFTRRELWESRESVLLPGSASIARAIIEHWYGGDLAVPPPADGTAIG